MGLNGYLFSLALCVSAIVTGASLPNGWGMLKDMRRKQLAEKAGDNRVVAIIHCVLALVMLLFIVLAGGLGRVFTLFRHLSFEDPGLYQIAVTVVIILLVQVVWFGGHAAYADYRLTRSNRTG